MKHISDHYTETAERAFQSGTKAGLSALSFAAAGVLATSLGYFLFSLLLIIIAGVCLRYAVTATKDMRHFYQGARHERSRREAHKQSHRIYL